MKPTDFIDAWGNYYFRTEGEEPKAYTIKPFFAVYCVYFNVVDDIEELEFTGNFADCVAYVQQKGGRNYDPLAKWR